MFCQNNIIAHSNKRNVKFIVNNKIKNWSISPKTKPDVFKVYCYKKENKVSLQTDVDTLDFIIKDNSNHKFKIILNSKDTAYTEIHGIKKLKNTITSSDKIFYLSKIWSEIKYNFCKY